MTTGIAVDRARQVLEDVYSLLQHHPAQQDPKAGRPAGPGYGHLLRSGVALAYTAWEVYVEEALRETVEHLVTSCEPDHLPKDLRAWVVEKTSDPWAFVGTGWRGQVLVLVEQRLEGDGTGKFGFNTANVSNVEALYSQVLGFSPLREVKWPKKSNASVRKSIEELVSVRGEIVHKGTTPGSLTLDKVRRWADFVKRLSEGMDKQLETYRQEMVAVAS
ncbi:HEPN domain-containing protein [Cellulosimicrobium cellulans]